VEGHAQEAYDLQSIKEKLSSRLESSFKLMIPSEHLNVFATKG